MNWLPLTKRRVLGATHWRGNKKCDFAICLWFLLCSAFSPFEVSFTSSRTFFIPGVWHFVSLFGVPAHSGFSAFMKGFNLRVGLSSLSRLQRFHRDRLGAVAAANNA